MIVLKVCVCGRSHEAREWSRLSIVSRGVEDGREVKRRRCTCGRILTVTVHEDDCAVAIDDARFRMANAYGRAKLECALLALASAMSFPRRWQSFVLVRAEARAERDRAHLLEKTLASIYRARELLKPALRVGRNLVVVVNEEAEIAEAAR